MKRLLLLAACALMPMVWTNPATAGQQGQAKAQIGAGGQNEVRAAQPVDERVVPPYMSVRDKVIIQREIQKRGAASRNALMRDARTEQQAR